MSEVTVISKGEEYTTKIVGDGDEVMDMVLHLVYTATEIHAQKMEIPHSMTLKAFAFALNELAKEEERDEKNASGGLS